MSANCLRAKGGAHRLPRCVFYVFIAPVLLGRGAAQKRAIRRQKDHSMSDPLKFKPVLAVQPVEDDSDYREFADSTRVGLRFIPEQYGGSPACLKADFGDFAKWIRLQQPDLPISIPEGTPKIALHGADIWLPLMQLAADTSMQVFLNMTASYLYDKAKGALKTDSPRIHMSVIYQDKRQGTTKKFEFTGDYEALTKAIKRFDLDNFFRDKP